MSAGSESLTLVFVMLKKNLDYWYIEDRPYNQQLRAQQSTVNFVGSVVALSYIGLDAEQEDCLSKVTALELNQGGIRGVSHEADLSLQLSSRTRTVLDSDCHLYSNSTLCSRGG